MRPTGEKKVKRFVCTHGGCRANDHSHERLPPYPWRVEDERFSTPPPAQTSKSGTVGFAQGNARPLRPSAFLLFALFAYFLSLSSFREKRKRENRQKNTTVNDSKKNPLPGEVSRLHRDGEGLTFTVIREPYLNRLPAFSLAAKGAKKKLSKKKRRQGVSTLRRRGGLRALHRRQAPLKRGLDSPNKKAKTSAKHRRFLRRAIIMLSAAEKSIHKLVFLKKHLKNQ